jgi:hypothetical protein
MMTTDPTGFTMCLTEEDALARAFPDPATAEAAHDLIGEAITALIDRGHSLPAARALLQRAVTALIHVYEC